MMRSFTHSWQYQFCQKQKKRNVPGDTEGDPLLYSAGNKFHQKGVVPGDRLYILSIHKGDLYLIGRMEVETIIGQQAARRRFSTEVWPAQEYAVAKPSTATKRYFGRKVPKVIAETLEFTAGLRITKLCYHGETIDRQTLRAIRELTPDSSKELDKLIDTPADLIESRIASAAAAIAALEAEWQIPEGKAVSRLVNIYERDPRVRTKAIDQHGIRCQA